MRSLSTADFKANLTYTNTPVDTYISFAAIGSNESTISDLALVAVPVFIGTSSSTDYGIIIKGFIKANASTGGTVDLQWAQNTSQGTATVLYEGSWMTITKIS